MMDRVDRVEFCTKLRAACTVVACRCIGDEVVYNKFLLRQCTIGERASIELLNGVKFVEHLQTSLKNVVGRLESTGNERVAQVMRILRDTPSFDFGRVNICSVCSLTGRMSDSFVVLRTSDYGILIDTKYAKLLHCIWVLWHIIDIETARVEQYDDVYLNMSIRAGIDAYLSQSGVTDDELDCYYVAYECVFKALENVLFGL